MKHKYSLLVGIIIVGIFSVGYAQPEKPATENEEIKIIYTIGSGWTGWHETLTINNDGSVNFEEQKPFKGNKTAKTIQLSNSERC